MHLVVVEVIRVGGASGAVDLALNGRAGGRRRNLRAAGGSRVRRPSSQQSGRATPELVVEWAHGRGMLALLKYPFYPLFIIDNGMNLISKSLTVLTPA